MERTAKFICIIGKPNCGKSTAAEKLMTAAGKGLIITPDFDNWNAKFGEIDLSEAKNYHYTGIKSAVYQSDEDFGYIYNWFFDGLLVLDDCRNYVPANFDHSQIANIIRRKRQRMMDIAIMAHQLSEVPKKFFGYITEYLIFPTEGNADARKDVLFDKTEKLNAIIARVNHRAIAEHNEHVSQYVKVEKL
ncbi:MAG: hypothetical protein J6Y55_06505 [Bacteroidales bacterium]|nr:hypothetical protein [Bacteroidales bacterium]